VWKTPSPNQKKIFSEKQPTCGVERVEIGSRSPGGKNQKIMPWVFWVRFDYAIMEKTGFVGVIRLQGVFRARRK